MRRNRYNVPDHIRQARRKVRAKKWFFRHFSLYLVASFFFFSMNILDNDLYEAWFLYPVISWGTLVAFQYLLVFGFPFTKAGTSEWEERELAREIARRAPAEYEEIAPPAPRHIAPKKPVDMDDHLELQEVSKVKKPIYRTDDLV
jgi:hypothetical protein